jgi:hypothetical protein
MLSPGDALESVRAISAGPRAAESDRLARIAAALAAPDPGRFVASVEIPRDAPPVMLALASKAATNYLPLLVDTFGQIMKVDGYFSAGAPDIADPWRWWQRNRMDAAQTGIHRAALAYGASYATVLPGVFGLAEEGPAITAHSPRKMTAVYKDASRDEWPLLAMRVDRLHVTLYDEEHLYVFGIERPQKKAFLPKALAIPWSDSMTEAGRLTYIETQTHDIGVCPVVRYRDRMLLDGEEQMGIVEPLMTIQERIHETTFGMLVAQYFAAFKQRYILGWIPKDQQEKLKMNAANVWTFNSPDVKIGELNETDLTRYIAAKNAAIRDFAAIGQIPAPALGVDGVSNISAEALAGLQDSRDRKTDEITTSLGESHEQLLRLCAHVAGDPVAASDWSSEVRWKDATARSFAQTVDGLVKLGAGLGVPAELLWEQIPGWTQQTVTRAVEITRSGDSIAALTDVLSEQGQVGAVSGG